MVIKNCDTYNVDYVETMEDDDDCGTAVERDESHSSRNIIFSLAIYHVTAINSV